METRAIHQASCRVCFAPFNTLYDNSPYSLSTFGGSEILCHRRHPVSDARTPTEQLQVTAHLRD